MILRHQVQDVVPITSYDTAGSFLLLGCNNGSIYYIGKRACSALFNAVCETASKETLPFFVLNRALVASMLFKTVPLDMQKFPLRMKDNDLLVTELYHDPSNDAITALSVYLTPKTSQCLAGSLSFPGGFWGFLFSGPYAGFGAHTSAEPSAGPPVTGAPCRAAFPLGSPNAPLPCVASPRCQWKLD